MAQFKVFKSALTIEAELNSYCDRVFKEGNKVIGIHEIKD